MTRQVACLALVTLAVSATLTVSAQQTRDTAPPPQATGRIRGTVVGAESGRPIRFAKVAILSNNGAQEALTDDGGGFTFERLKPGSYTLRFSKAGYLDVAYGQARPGTATPGKPIPLADRQQFDDLVVRLSQGGSISGVIRDDRGDPAYGANVRISRWLMRNGIRTLEAVESTTTDERGRYRVSLLPPRDYVISAMPNEDAIPDIEPARPMQGFAPVFYPGAISSRAASTVSLALGEDRADVDFQLSLVPLGRVTGSVLSTDGKVMTNIPVRLTNREHDDFEQGTQTDGGGRFTFERVVPGAYAASVGKSSRSGHVTFTSKKFSIDGSDISLAIGLKRELYEVTKAVEAQLTFLEAEVDANGRVTRSTSVGAAYGEVNVTGMTTSDIVLTMEPLRTVAGRITTEGASKPPVLRGTVVWLMSASQSGELFETKVTDDGSFVIANVAPGKYSVMFAGEAPPWNLASAMVAGVDTLDYLLEVPRDRDVRDLVLTLRDRSSELAGSVTDAASKPATDRTVIMFPSDERLWLAGERRVKAVSLGADGKYLFEDVRPGSYLVALTDSVEPDEWLDPEFLKKLVVASVPVTIAEAEKRVQDLRIR